jgi:hypothetical protein
MLKLHDVLLYCREHEPLVLQLYQLYHGNNKKSTCVKFGVEIDDEHNKTLCMKYVLLCTFRLTKQLIVRNQLVVECYTGNGVGGTCSTHWRDDKCIHFSWKTQREETTRKTLAYMGMDLSETGWEVDRGHLAQDMDRWQVLVNMVMNLSIL